MVYKIILDLIYKGKKETARVEFDLPIQTSSLDQVLDDFVQATWGEYIADYKIVSVSVVQ